MASVANRPLIMGLIAAVDSIAQAVSLQMAFTHVNYVSLEV
jgi:hypothetical protein